MKNKTRKRVSLYIKAKKSHQLKKTFITGVILQQIYRLV